MARRFRDQRLYERDGSRFLWCRVADEHGRIRRVSTRCTDEAAAAAFADEWERKAADPGYRRASEATLGSAIGDWLEHLRRKGMNAATYTIAENKVGHFVRLWGESWPLSRIESDTILRYIDVRKSEPGVRGNVKPLTIKRELEHLVRVLDWAKFRGVFTRDLGTIIPPDFSGEHRPKTRCPSPEEAVKLIRSLEARRGAHVAWILATGSRVAEAGRAHREDAPLDDENPHVAIRGSKTDLATGSVPVTGLTHPFLVYALQHAPGRPGEPLFDPWGKYWRDIQAACVRAGIEPLSPNDLRRAYGKWHRLAGATAEEVSIMLRHATDTLAQTTYARVDGRDIGPRMRVIAPVPEPYSATTTTSSNDLNGNGETWEKQAPPAVIETATFGLGNQLPPDALSIRSRGQRLAWERRKKR